LFDEGGGRPKFSAIELALEWEGRDGVSFEPSFRVTNVTGADVSAVYDLKLLANDENKYRLPLELVQTHRTTPADWRSSELI
jgi:hypothetical protein